MLDSLTYVVLHVLAPPCATNCHMQKPRLLYATENLLRAKVVIVVTTRRNLQRNLLLHDELQENTASYYLSF